MIDDTENLLTATVKLLEANDLTPSDVRWVGSNDLWTTWENFAEVANVTYDAGFGAQIIAEDLVIVGDDWWMERHEYDGSEWWEFKRLPVRPDTQRAIWSMNHYDIRDFSVGTGTLGRINLPGDG